MGLLIDSSVVIQLEREGRPFIEFLQTQVPSEEFAISAVTASELLVGVHRGAPPARQAMRRTYIEAVLAEVPILSFDVGTARLHAELWAGLSAVGQMIGAHDLIIAATALANDCAILTENIRDFNRFPNLEVRQPAW